MKIEPIMLRSEDDRVGSGKIAKDKGNGLGNRNSKGMESSLGDDGLVSLSLADMDERRRSLQKRAWGVMLEYLTKKSIEPLCVQEGYKDKVVMEGA
ncbi:hypothetical protein Q3G72_002424 [Acer saccharum]|nr:hypothetical protein Q3G72_002424 [Acer saccharum]